MFSVGRGFQMTAWNGTLDPDIGPVAVGRFALELDVEARSRRVALEQKAHVHAVLDRLGDVQLEAGVFHAGFLQVELRFVDVDSTLRQ